MSQVTALSQPRSHLRLSQTLLMTARRAAKVMARKLNANVDYDLHLYDAISAARRWSSNDVVVDVGANDGRTIFRLMRHLPSPRIYALEPVSATFRTLTGHTREMANVRRFQLALGAEVGQQTMYLYDQASINSLHPDWGQIHGRKANAEQPTETIEMTTLDRFAAEQNLEHVHLLKVDAEGYDLEVLKGATQCLRESRVGIIQVEAGLGAVRKHQPSLQEFQTYLSEFDYHLYGIYNQCRAPIAAAAASSSRAGPLGLVFCDALFVSARDPA